MVQWSTRPESRKGVADIKVGLSTLFRDSQEGSLRIPVADVPSNPWELVDGRTRARPMLLSSGRRNNGLVPPLQLWNFPLELNLNTQPRQRPASTVVMMSDDGRS